MSRKRPSFFKDLKKISWADVRSGFIPVLVGYAIVGAFSLMGPISLPPMESELSPPAALGVTLLFTFTHGVIPVFFYRFFIFGPQEMLSSLPAGQGRFVGVGFLGVFVLFGYAHMTLWYGIPIAFLAYHTGWLPLAAAAVHVALAGKGRRAWLYIEYGSTSLSLMLLLMVMGPFFASPLWTLLVLLCQGVLMALVECLGRPLWVTEPAPAAGTLP